MPMDNSLHGGEPNAGAFERLLRMQPLEDTKQLVLILHIKTYAVIFNKHDQLIGCVVYRTNFYVGPTPSSREFQRVRDEVSKHEPKHGRISMANRQSPNAPNNISTPRVGCDLTDHGSNQLFEVDCPRLRFGPANP